MGIPLTPAFTAYLTAYSTACIVAAFLMYRERNTLILFQQNYRRYLRSTWKIVTFVIAASGMTIIAPLTGDPTWDYFDAAFMSILTFLTAPWSVGTLYLAFQRKVKLSHAYIAVCVWMFSASWAYDVYILIKHDYYPPTWLPNIILSSILYVAAGTMWNLQQKDGRGVVFGFMEPGWPDANRELGFRQIGWFALPIMILVTLMIAPFIL